MPRSPIQPKELYERSPICFATAWDLRDEVTEANPDELLRVFQRNRDCSSFTPWQQGFTPKEHREMMDRERARQWQAERERADRDWRRQQRRDDVRWRIFELLAVGVIVPLAIIIATLVLR